MEGKKKMGALSCVIARAGGGNGTNINWKQPTTGVNNTKMDDATLVVGCHEPLVVIDDVPACREP